MEPVETYLKNNKRGIGAEKVKKKTERPPKVAGSESNIDKRVGSAHFISFISVIGPPTISGKKKIPQWLWKKNCNRKLIIIMKTHTNAQTKRVLLLLKSSDSSNL